MVALLYILFFISGGSALIFEMLWFRQTGLALGNSVWASALVLSGFMGGMAMGNLLAARHGARVRNPVRAYAVAEVAIAVTGVGLVFLLPVFGAAVTPWFRPLLDQPGLLNASRLVLAFLLLLVPSTAMGITLPLLTRAVTAAGAMFGPALGRLYGWNTAGAVIGVAAGEMYLVGAIGVHGTAVFAGALNLAAAAVAVWMSRLPALTMSPAATATRRETMTPASAVPWLIAAFLSGFCLLALEVVWFRFLLLFVKGHSTALALILALVLTGIALGGLAASAWLSVAPAAHRFAATLAFVAGFSGVISYGLFPAPESASSALVVDTWAILRLAAPLILPVSFCSGVFFTLTGAALRSALRSETETTGTLALSNTTGAALGSLAGGLLLLPLLGIERSFFLVAVLYGTTGALLAMRSRQSRPPAGAGAVVLILCLALFPFGSLDARLLPAAVGRWFPDDGETRTVAVREGLTETIVYVQRQMLGHPVSYAMLTNAYSMSATSYGARRYMKLYVYWPLAIHPNPRRALLIGYGVGNTAKAMTDSKSLETIDIVDLSRDILEMSTVVYPDTSANPLHDPRVRIHVEDGRYLLQTSDRQFDLITGEPPPPGIAGVEHLYSREYFRLMHQRLADGGIVTYWLPLSDLSDVSAKAILRAFCDVFADCSLWNGSGTHLMMVGTRGASGSATEEAFIRQWNDPSVAVELRRLGLERPEQLGALFIGDAEYVRGLTGDVPALTDDNPRLIDAQFSSPDAGPRLISSMADTGEARARFETSPLIARLWPERLRKASLPYFDVQDTINAHMYGELLDRPNAMEDVHALLTQSSLEEPVLWRLGSNSDIQQIVARATPDQLMEPLVQFHRGIRLIAERQYADAAAALNRARTLTSSSAGPDAASIANNAFALETYALCMAGLAADAQDLMRAAWQQSLSDRGVSDAPLPPFWVWMKETFGVDPRTVGSRQ